MGKIINIPSKLSAYLEGDISFKWGTLDCILFCYKWVDSLGHKDLPKVGEYSNEFGAMLTLKRMGFNSVSEAVDNYLSSKELAFLKRGDIVAIKTEHPILNCNLGIFDGKYGCFLDPNKGLVKLKKKDINLCWSIL